MQKSNNFINYAGILLSVIFWGLSFIWSKSLLNAGMGTIAIVFLRLVIATAFIFLIMALGRQFRRIARSDIKYLILLGTFQPFFYFLFETYSMNFVTATMASIVISTIPLFVPFAAWVLYKDRIYTRHIVGILVSLAGVVMVVWAGMGQQSQDTCKGVLLLLGAVVASVGYGMVVRRLQGRYSALMVVFCQNLVGIVLFLPLFFGFEIDDFSRLTVTGSMIGSLLILGTLCSALAFVFYVNGMNKVGITPTYLFCNLIPAATAIGAWFLLQEQLLPVQIVGIGVTVAGLMIGMRVPTPHRLSGQKPKDF